MLETEKEWQDFGKLARRLKENGVSAISFDIWWGVVETEENRFDWSVPYRMLDIIEKHGLKAKPIISMHHYQRVYEAFNREFSARAHLISEVLISLGAAGELRFPSYGPRYGQPWWNGGELQAFSDKALKAYEDFQKQKRPEGPLVFLSRELFREHWLPQIRSSQELDPAVSNFFSRSGPSSQ